MEEMCPICRADKRPFRIKKVLYWPEEIMFEVIQLKRKYTYSQIAKLLSAKYKQEINRGHVAGVVYRYIRLKRIMG